RCTRCPTQRELCIGCPTPDLDLTGSGCTFARRARPAPGLSPPGCCESADGAFVDEGTAGRAPPRRPHSAQLAYTGSSGGANLTSSAPEAAKTRRPISASGEPTPSDPAATVPSTRSTTLSLPRATWRNRPCTCHGSIRADV